MEIRYLPHRVLQRSRPSVPDLWRRACDLMENLLDRLTSAHRLARVTTLERHHRRYLQDMIEPLELLVRSLLLSDTVAWLTTTDEGADIMREEAARREQHAAPGPASSSVAARITRIDPPAPDQLASEQSEPESDPTHDTAPTAPTETVTVTAADIEAEIARALEPGNLRFRLTDPPRIPWAEPQETPARSPRAQTPRKRPSAALRFARRVEALRLIIANPMPMVRILARYLARRHMPPMDVPTPYTHLRQGFGLGAKEIILARAISFVRFWFLQETKQRRDTLALPPPQPG